MQAEKIKKLKKVKPDPIAFLREKAKVGFAAYRFEELVRYKGYDEAVKVASSYYRAVRKDFNESVLVKDYLAIHAVGFYIEATDGFGHFCFKAREDGQLFPDFQEHFREAEARLKATYDLFKITKITPYV